MPVSSITVRISDGIKTADYAPPKLYDLTAVILDPEDIETESRQTIAVLKKAGDAFLGRGLTTAPVEEAKAEPVVRRGRRTKAEIEAAKAEADPMSVEEDSPAPSTPVSAKDLTDDPMAVSDDWSSDPEEEVAVEITDDDLNKATQQKNASLANPAKIRELIGSFNPDKTKTFQLRQIPQAQRADYLAKLKDLA